MKVYVMTSGDYSDKSIVAVFSKEEDAERAEALFGWDREAFEIDAENPSA